MQSYIYILAIDLYTLAAELYVLAVDLYLWAVDLYVYGMSDRLGCRSVYIHTWDTRIYTHGTKGDLYICMHMHMGHKDIDLYMYGMSGHLETRL